MAGESILIIDDNPTNVKLLSVLLGACEYEVTVAASAEEALAILESYTPRLILVDIQLPGMDGLALTRVLRRRPDTRDLAIVAVTAYAMKGDEDSARAAGCDNYVTKPIDTRALPSVIAAELERASQRSLQ